MKEEVPILKDWIKYKSRSTIVKKRNEQILNALKFQTITEVSLNFKVSVKTIYSVLRASKNESNASKQKPTSR